MAQGAEDMAKSESRSVMGRIGASSPALKSSRLAVGSLKMTKRVKKKILFGNSRGF
jgi:hypothetical protein